MNKLILTIIITLFIGSVVAAGSLVSLPKTKIDLDKAKVDTLKEMGVNELKIQEYACSGDRRCFKVSSELPSLNNSLVDVPLKVCGEKVYRNVSNKKIYTGACLYRDITDDEIMIIVEKNLIKKVDVVIDNDKAKTDKGIKYSDIEVISK